MADLRMRDVCARTGLSRQAVHFYVEQRLVAPPEKTGKTMAYYTEAHVERILLIRKLQEEHFLPLRAIRAMLDDQQGEFSRAQRHVLSEVKARLPSATTGDGPAAADVALVPLLRRAKLARRDADELARAGLIEIVRGRVSADDAWLVELWGEVRAAGFTRELGFGPELLVMFVRGIERIFEDEKRILARLAAALPAARVAEMVESALPLVHSLLVRAHERRVRALFGNLEQPS